MSSFCKYKSYSHFFSKNVSIYAVFNDQSFNDTLTTDIVSFEQVGPVIFAQKHNSKLSEVILVNANKIHCMVQ